MTQSHQHPQCTGAQACGPQTDTPKPDDDRASRWEERYASVEQLWSGRPNDWLPELAANWSPGSALEIGCGEGADVLWLAERGWRVTGLDLSATAIGRLTRHAERLGVASRVTGQVHDVGAGLPEGPFDLVTSFYVHGGPQEGSLDLVALLSHAADELLEGLAGATTGWETVGAEERRRQATGPDGQEGSRADAVVCLRRPDAPAS